MVSDAFCIISFTGMGVVESLHVAQEGIYYVLISYRMSLSRMTLFDIAYWNVAESSQKSFK
uniref:Uncharacterized protein n=1 Tax=Anguilla anguilla TaxID=7936 RepID=A0A0E9SWX5_ANGAN